MKKVVGIDDNVNYEKWNKKAIDYVLICRLFEFHRLKCKLAWNRMETPWDINSAKHKFLLSISAVETLCSFFTELEMKKIKFVGSPHLEVVARRLAMKVLNELALEKCLGWYDSIHCARKTSFRRIKDAFTKIANQNIKDYPPTLIKGMFRSNPAKHIKRLSSWDWVIQ